MGAVSGDSVAFPSAPDVAPMRRGCFDEPDSDCMPLWNETALRALDSAKLPAGDYLGLAAMPLRLGVMCTIGALRFTPFLAGFRREFPGLRLNVAEGTPERLLAQLDAGGLDLAVMAQPGAYAPRWRVTALYRERFVVALPFGHKLAKGRAVALADLAGASYVDRESCEYGNHIGALMDARGVAVEIVYASDREDWVQMMIVSGAGLACMPEFSGLLPGLVVRPMTDPEVVREISLVAPAGRRPTPAAETFARAIARYDWSL